MESTASTRDKKLQAVVLLLASMTVVIAVWPSNAGQSRNPSFYINWLSHGTALSNLFSAVIYAVAAVALLLHKTLSDRFDRFRGAATVFMVTALLVYPFFLMSRPYFHDNFFEWRDFVLHWGDPFFMLCWWLIQPPVKPISASRSFVWLIPGAAYLLYILTRGALVNWYPYYILYPDPKNGAARMVEIVVIAAIAFILIAQFVAWTSRVNKDRHRSH
jgi:hypothetical protein